MFLFSRARKNILRSHSDKSEISRNMGLPDASELELFQELLGTVFMSSKTNSSNDLCDEEQNIQVMTLTT
jgi:hypothetical protein